MIDINRTFTIFFGLILVAGISLVESSIAIAETSISCPATKKESKVVPDHTPYERFTVDQCWCAAEVDVRAGLNDLSNDLRYQEARTKESIRAELIRALGLNQNYSFIAARDPEAASGSQQAYCLSDKDLDQYAESVKNLRDQNRPFEIPYIEVTVKEDSGKEDDGNSDAPKTNDDQSNETDVAQTEDYSEVDPQDLEDNQLRRDQEEKKRRELEEKLADFDEYYRRESEQRNEKIEAAQNALDQTKSRKAQLEKELADRLENRGFLERTFDIFSGGYVHADPVIDSLYEDIEEEARKIQAIPNQIAMLVQEATNREAEFQRLRQRLRVEIVKAETETREREEARRQQNALDLQLEIRIRSQLLSVGIEEYERRIRDKRSIAEEFRERGDEEGAKTHDKEADRLQEERDRYFDIASNPVEGAIRELQNAFEANRRDGIGPTSVIDVVNRIEAEGGNVEVVLRGEIASADAKQRAAETAARLASNAGRSTEFVSIFSDGLTSEALTDFFQDQGEVNAQYWDDPQLFFKRYGAFAVGSGRAVKDGVVDLGALILEIGDLGGELVETSLREGLGIDTNLFGTEDREFIQKVLGSINEPDGAAVNTTVDNFKNFIERRFAQQAGAGDVDAALDDAGYVFTTVVGGEELVFMATSKVIAKGKKIVKVALVERRIARGVRGAGRVARRANRIGDGADTASDVARVANAGNLSGAETVRFANGTSVGQETITIGNRQGFSPIPDPANFAPLPDVPRQNFSGPGSGVANVPNGLSGVDEFAPKNPFSYTEDDLARLFPDGARNPTSVNRTPQGELQPGATEFANAPTQLETLAPGGSLQPQEAVAGFGNSKTELEAVASSSRRTPVDGSGATRQRRAPADGSQMRPGKELPDIDSRTVEVERTLDDKGRTVDATLERAGGEKIQLTTENDLLGAGSFTEAYRAPNSPPGAPPVVVKITEDIRGAFIDEYGYRAIAAMDDSVIQVPKIHARYRSVENAAKRLDGTKIPASAKGLITIADEVPPTIPLGTKLSPSQVDAYHRGIDALNTQGYVFLDNKFDNYTFRTLPDGNDVLVVLDTGAIIKTTGANPAERAAKAMKIQQVIDSPAESLTKLADEALEKFKKAQQKLLNASDDTVKRSASKAVDAARADFNREVAAKRQSILIKLLSDVRDTDLDFADFNKVLRESGYTGPDFNTIDPSGANIDGLEPIFFSPINGVSRPELRRSPSAVVPKPSASIHLFKSLKAVKSIARANANIQQKRAA